VKRFQSIPRPLPPGGLDPQALPCPSCIEGGVTGKRLFRSIGLALCPTVSETRPEKSALKAFSLALRDVVGAGLGEVRFTIGKASGATESTER